MTHYALHDPGLARARIFRPLGRGIAKTRKNDLRTDDFIEINDPHLGKIDIKIRAALPVGAKEEDLLLVLLALAGLNDSTKKRHTHIIFPGTEEHAKCVEEMRIEHQCIPCHYYKVVTTKRIIMREMSNDDNFNPNADEYEYLKDRLERLSWVGYTVTGKRGNRRWWSGMSALLKAELDEDNIAVTFNERIARVVLGIHDFSNPDKPKKKQWFSKISLDERFSLRTDAAKIMHRIISVCVDKEWTYTIESLVGQVYGYKDVAARTQRYRTATIRQGLEEISHLPRWSVEMDASEDAVTVRRLS
jgi:hypothetical protein